MRKPKPSSPAPSLRTLLLTTFLGGLALGTASYACAPVSQRLATPLACPRGTVDSAVVTHVTRNDHGSVVTQFDFRCLDRDGGSTEPSGLLVLGTLALYGMGVVLVFAILSFLRRKAALGTVVLALWALGGCQFGTLTQDEFEARYPYAAGPMFSTGGAMAALRTLEAELGGPARVTSITLGPDFVSFIVVKRGTQNDRDVYTVREDGVGEPTPLQTSEHEAVDESFALDPALLAKIPAIVRAAPSRVGIADGHVSSLNLSRDGSALEFRADVESAHRRGSARFDASGAFLRSEID